MLRIHVRDVSVIVGIAIALAGGGTDPGWAAVPSEVQKEACYECHGGKSQTVGQLAFVDLEALASSAHADLQCLDCHTDAREKVLEDGHTIAHPKSLAPVECTSCHHRGNEQGAPNFSPMPQYKTSVHGRASIERGDEDVATCSDCHGKHNIRAATDPESTINRTNIPRTCAVCHENMQMILKHNIHVEQPYSEYQQSVHGKSLFIDGLATMAAVCTDCHGVHDIQANGEADLKPHQPSTCGKCHLDEYKAYNKSIHGKAFKEKIQDAPVCADCHGEHKIASPWDPGSRVSALHVTDTCAACHDDVAKMSKYSILTDKVSTFKHSDHGMGSDLGIISVATCVSCHGYHSILPANSPESSINAANLATTCGKSNCHPNPSPKLLQSKIHIVKKDMNIEYLRKIRTISLWSIAGLFSVGAIVSLAMISVRIRRRLNGSSSPDEDRSGP